jgi:hypothetical protein
VAAEVGRNISARQLSRSTAHPESQLRNQGVQSKLFIVEAAPFVHKTKSFRKKILVCRSSAALLIRLLVSLDVGAPLAA